MGNEAIVKSCVYMSTTQGVAICRGKILLSLIFDCEITAVLATNIY